MKKILLLGDSIRRNYQPLVKEKLNGIAEVVGPEDNCRFAKYTLWYVNSWISEFGKPDIIHWNNGIWDTYLHNKEMGIFTALKEYKSDISRTLNELRKTGAIIIWATTTPVNEKNTNNSNSDIDKYNKEIEKYMLKENIAINDLNKVVKENLESFIDEDNVHLSDQGKQACAEAVVKAVMKYIP